MCSVLPDLSLLPAIAYKKSKIDDTPNTDNHWIKDINFDLITRAAVVYNTNMRQHFSLAHCPASFCGFSEISW